MIDTKSETHFVTRPWRTAAAIRLWSEKKAFDSLPSQWLRERVAMPSPSRRHDTGRGTKTIVAITLERGQCTVHAWGPHIYHDTSSLYASQRDCFT